MRKFGFTVNCYVTKEIKERKLYKDIYLQATKERRTLNELNQEFLGPRK